MKSFDRPIMTTTAFEGKFLVYSNFARLLEPSTEALEANMKSLLAIVSRYVKLSHQICNQIFKLRMRSAQNGEG
jgi:hypothetical protein